MVVAVPPDTSDFNVTLGGPAPSFPIGPIAGTIQHGLTAPATYAEVRPLIEQAVRRAATAAAVPNGLKPLLAQATVDLIGAGTSADPYHFHVRLGHGARPFSPDATITMAGAGANTARLSGAGVSVSPQQLVLKNGRDGRVLDAAGAVFQVPPEMFQGVAVNRTGLFALEDVDIFNPHSPDDAAILSALDAILI